MSVRDIVRKYESSNDKVATIKQLASENNVSERELINMLNYYHIETPRILSRDEAVELDELDYIRQKEQIEFEKDLHNAVSVNKLFAEYGIDDIKGVEQTKKLLSLAETKKGMTKEQFVNIINMVLMYILENDDIKDIEQIVDKEVIIGAEQRTINYLQQYASSLVADLKDDFLGSKNNDDGLLSESYKIFKRYGKTFKDMDKNEKITIIAECFDLIDNTFRKDKNE